MLNTYIKLKDKINNLETLINAKQDKLKAGTWTPAIIALDEAGPTINYQTQQGNWRKIGDLVYLDFYIRGNIVKLNGTNNYVAISGVPYPFDVNKFGQVSLSLGVCYNLLEDNITPQLLGVPDSYTIRVQMNSGTAATKLKTSSNIGYFELGGSGVYKTN